MSSLNEHIEQGVVVSKILGSTTRFKILHILMHTHDNICVKEIAEAINLSHSATSHQLSKLESQGVVKCHRHGQTMCYVLTDSRLSRKIAAVITQLV